MARKINKKVSRKSSRKMHKPMRKMWSPSGAVRQSGWMADRWNMASQKASEYGTMASQKASEYGTMASQKAKDMYGRYMKKESTDMDVEAPRVEKVDAQPEMMPTPEVVSMEKPKRRRSTKRRTMKRTMKKKSQKRYRQRDISGRDAAFAGIGGLGGALIDSGNRWRGALIGGVGGALLSKATQKKKN